jgi:hypothetical protein
LTKIFGLIERDESVDYNLFEKSFINMMQSSEEIKECLLNFANQKPKKKLLSDYGEDIVEKFKIIL